MVGTHTVHMFRSFNPLRKILSFPAFAKNLTPTGLNAKVWTKVMPDIRKLG